MTVKRAQPVRISPASASDLDTCAELLREYAESLGIDLSFQPFQPATSEVMAQYVRVSSHVDARPSKLV